MSTARPIVLLGPQREQRTVADAVRGLGVEGPVATVTAGWEEREAEDTELRDHLGRHRPEGVEAAAEAALVAAPSIAVEGP